MLKIFINGIGGKMGSEVANLILKEHNFQLLGGLDRFPCSDNSYPIFSDINSLSEIPDVIIDFSASEATIAILPYCISNHIPIVIATTGFSKEQQDIIKNASLQIK